MSKTIHDPVLLVAAAGTARKEEKRPYRAFRRMPYVCHHAAAGAGKKPPDLPPYALHIQANQP